MATYYLHAVTGSDVANGSFTGAWKTFAKAHNTSTTGDTIVVLSSSGTFAALDYSNTTGPLTKSLTISGQNAATCVFFGLVVLQFASNTTNNWSNITIDGDSFHIDPYPFNFLGTVNSTFTNCVFKRAYGYSTSYPAFSAVSQGTLSFYNCVFREYDQTSGIIVVRGDTGVMNFNLHNNIFYWGSGTTPSTPPASTGTSCVLSNKNNIFYNTTGYAVTNTIGNQNCCFYGVGSTLGTGSISADPLFVDVSNANYNLRPTSPCINSGTLI